ncbi:flagellar hook-length control protein FliK [Acidovorax sp. GW101-3H11]|uniref:flagellar hook-length control protein FliK n=1 Tax=Acidovorax sp. GW101-3H11 TaxID=1813946 RepID=UPI000B046204|nr:flagellar hook-length control protein FliK [Acidovorax sp. GW101-3H11]
MEQGKVFSAQGGTHAAHATRAKAPAQQGAEASDAAAAGGFLALLAALDEVSVDTGPLELTGTDAGPADIAADAVKGEADAAALAAFQGLFASAQSDAAATGLVRQADGTLRPDSMANGMPGAVTPGALGDVALNGPVAYGGLPQGLVAETAKLDTAADFKDGTVQSTVAGFGRSFSRLQNTQAQRAGGAGGAELSTVASAAGDATQRLSVAQGVAAALAQAASNERPAVGVMAGGATVERGVGAPAATEGGFAALADGLFASVAAARGAESSAGGRPGEGPAGGGAWSDGSAGVSPLEPGNTDSPATFVDPGAAGSEEQVADQVAYWVNQKTQNAELTLNRDGQPVEVSVSLSGNEAHVTFRSDQAQTRELLDQSMAQLRELLRGEGLVLSGMSVGTSARDGAGAQGGDAGQPRGRDGARQAQVLSSAPVGTASLARDGSGPDRTVDIFV